MNWISSWVTAAVLAQLAPVAASAAGNSTYAGNQLPLRYKDAHGTVVGRYLWSGKTFVVMHEAGQTFAAPIGNLGSDFTKVGFVRGRLFYSSEDCSGQGYQLFVDPVYGLEEATVLLPTDGRVLVFVAGGVPDTVQTRSVRDSQLQCSPNDLRDTMVPVADTPIDITGKYAPPLSLR